MLKHNHRLTRKERRLNKKGAAINENLDEIREKEYRRSLRVIPSTQNSMPFYDVYNGCMIMKDGTFTKVFEVNPTNFSLKPPSEQEVIISRFSKLLKLAPLRIRFKSVARPTNIEDFISDLKKDMEKEKTAKALIRHRDQIELIKEVSQNSSISHRFFCIITYDPQKEDQHANGMSVENYTNILNRICLDMIAAFDDTGNTVNEIDPGQEDFVENEILYYLLSPKRAEKESYGKHASRILKKYCNHKKVSVEEAPYIPSPELVAPGLIDLKHSDHYMVDYKYSMVGYVPSNEYPLVVPAGWTDFIVNCAAGVDVDLYLEKTPREDIIPKLRRTVAHSRVAMNGETDQSDNYGVAMDAVVASQYLQEGLKNHEEFVSMAMLVTVSADSYEQCKENFRAVQKLFKTSDLVLHNTLYHTEEAYESVMPFGWISKKLFKKAKQNMLTIDAASSYIFTSYSICDKNGIFLGTNEDNMSTTLVDIFDADKYRNANMAILGSSGAGKTYLTQCMSLRMRLKQNQVFCIIPKKGEEFKPACDAVNGQYINVSGASRHCINIMEIRKPNNETNRLLYGEEIEQSLVSQKAQSIKTFISLLVTDMSLIEQQVLDIAIIETYAKAGMTKDNESLWDPDHPGQFKKMPILSDLYNVLMDKPETVRIATIMRELVDGSSSAFNGQTNVDLDNLYIVFDLDKLSDSMKAVGMYIVLDFVWDKAKEDKTKRKVIVLDELWALIGANTTDVAAEFVLQIFKLIRGYGGSAICATQDINDFFAYKDGKYGKGIINACKFKIVLGLEEEEANRVQGVLELENGEIEKIKGFKRGKGMVCVNHNNIAIDIKSSYSELELFSTDPQIMAQVAEKKRRQRYLVH